MRKLTTEEFQNRLDEIYGKGEYIVLSEYVNNCTKVDILHTKCNKVFRKAPVKITGATKEGCYICSGKNRYKTRETLQAEVDEKYPDTYEIIGEYINARTPIRVRKLKCGHEYDISPDNLLRGKGCPKCWVGHSHYMQIVEDYFDDRGIEYVCEKRFEDCKNIRALPFDYYLPSYNTCVEVDGQFHYSNCSRYAKDDTAFKQISFRDGIKTKYCEDNGINLIRLPYFEEKNFEKILDEKLYVNTEITKAI